VWKNFNFVKSTSGGGGGTSITIKVLSSNSDPSSGAPAGLGSQTGVCSLQYTSDGMITSGDISTCAKNGGLSGRYLWYQATLGANTDGSKTPLLDSFTAKAQYDGTELQLSKNVSPLPGWSYRKTITLTNTSPSPISNYQTLVEVNTANLYSQGRINADCSDLRFTDNDETTLLDYWIEGGCNTATTQIWVTEKDTIAGNNGTADIYMYYGNTGATAGSQVWNSGNGLFILPNTSSCPAGWSAVNDLNNDSGTQRFPRGAATYGGKGGSATHTHNYSISAPAASAYTGQSSGAGTATSGHTHSLASTTNPQSNLPPFLDFVYCGSSNLVVPANSMISLFASDVPSGWTRFSALDSKFPRGGTAYSGTPGGAPNHTHTISTTISGAPDSSNYTNSADVASTAHTHTVNGTSDSASNIPSYLNMVFGQKNVQGSAAGGLIAMTNYSPPQGWTRFSALDANFPQGAATYGGTGGTSSTHTHGNITGTTGSAVGTSRSSSINGAYCSGPVHTHSFTLTFTSTASITPPYLDVIFIQRNTPVTSVNIGSSENQYNSYPSSQALTSSVFNSSSDSNLVNSISWNQDASLPSGTRVKFQMQSAPPTVSGGDTPGTWSGFVGPDNTSGTWFYYTSSGDHASGCSESSGTVTCTLPGGHILQNGGNDKFFQSKSQLESDGANTPTLFDLTIAYVVNAPPVITISNSPMQAVSTGMVDISYNIQNGGVGQNAESGDRFNAALFYTTEDGFGGSTLKLTSSISGADTTLGITGANGQYLPATGYIQIDNEIIYYPIKSGSGSSWTLGDGSHPILRAKWVAGSRTSQAATHNANAVIYAQLSTANVSTDPSSDGTAGIGDLKDSSGADLYGDSVDEDYLLHWDSKADSNFGDRYDANVKLKITVNDSNPANQIGSATSAAAFSVDTNAPQSSVISIDRSVDADRIKISASDNTTDSVEYAVDFPAASVNGSSTSCFQGAPSWQSFSYPTQDIDFPLDQDNGDKVRKACVQFKDKYGNISSTVYAITPSTPESFNYYDISNKDTEDYRVFLSWNVPETSSSPQGYPGIWNGQGNTGFKEYDLFRCNGPKGDDDACTDYVLDPQLLGNPITSEIQNNQTDVGLDSGQRYCYRLRFRDKNPNANNQDSPYDIGDYSKWTDPLCVVPGSGTSSISAGVSVHWMSDTDSEANVPSDQIYTSQATIKWQTVNSADGVTPIQTDSIVEWKEHKDPPSSWSSSEAYHNGTVSSDHSITIPGKLLPDTEYDYRVTSTIPWNPSVRDTAVGVLPATFHTKAGPVIQDVVNGLETTWNTVVWNPDTSTYDPANCSSTIYYSTGINPDDGTLESPQNASCPGGSSSAHTCNFTGLLSPGVTYYFYIYSVQDAPGSPSATDNNGGNYYQIQGSQDINPPTIENINGGGSDPLIKTDTQAAISWETNERSKSWIIFSKVTHPVFTPPSPQTSYDPTLVGENPYYNDEADHSKTYLANGNADYSHTFVMSLNSLDPDTTYYYRLVSEDLSGNYTVSSPQLSFTTLDTLTEHHDLTDPGDPIVDTWTDTEALAHLPAVSTESTSRLCWSISTLTNTDVNNCDADHLVAVADETMTHTYLLTGLPADTTIHIKTRIEDADKSGIYFYSPSDVTFHTKKVQIDRHDALADISTPVADLITVTSAVVSWTTDQPADSNVECSLVSGGPYTIFFAPDNNLNKKHSMILSGLDSNTDYYCIASSSDDLNNTLYSGNVADINDAEEFHFKTLESAEFQHDPLSEIESIEVPTDMLSDRNAVATFTTDQPAVCYAQIVSGIAADITGNYANADTVQEDGYAENKFNLSHSLHFTDLLWSTKYFFKITCHDNLFAIGGSVEITSAETTFTTLEKMDTQANWEEQGGGGDTTAPKITGVGTSAITGESVTVKWTTDEKANSSVEYGLKSGTYENGANNPDVNSSTDNYITSHEVIVNGLAPGTKYYFIARSINVGGLVGESSESTFTTKSNSSLSGIDFSSTKLGEVTVSWTTSEKTTSKVEYGLTNLYGDAKESTTQTTTHQINITGLESNLKYHFRVGGKDSLNNLYTSGDYTFTPKSPPTISNIKESDNNEHGTTINFDTNVPTDSLITYTNSTDSNDQGSQGNPQLTANHSIILKNLTPGTTYRYTITAKDMDGNSTTSPAEGEIARSFTTGVDKVPPKIDQVRTDSALAQNDKIQSIISWITDEPATTGLIYKEGLNAEPKEVKVSNQLTLTHIAVITTFKPGTVYYFNAKSVDVSGNESKSSDFALLTPKRKENIVQIIISNFQDIFAWAKF
jgi:hypothetical protein